MYDSLSLPEAFPAEYREYMQSDCVEYFTFEEYLELVCDERADALADLEQARYDPHYPDWDDMPW